MNTSCLIATKNVCKRFCLSSVIKGISSEIMTDTAENLEESIYLLKEKIYDFLIIDNYILGIQLEKILHAAFKKNPALKVCCICEAECERKEGLRLFHAGIRDLIADYRSIEQLKKGLRTFIFSKEHILPQNIRNAVENLEHLTSDIHTGSLSEREFRVIALLAEGYTNKEMSVLLATTPSAVASSRNRLLRKLGAENTLQAVIKILQMGYSMNDILEKK